MATSMYGAQSCSLIDRCGRGSGTTCLDSLIICMLLARPVDSCRSCALLLHQMVRVLDIISDYLRLRGYPHQRLDGSTPAAARHAGRTLGLTHVSLAP